MPQPCLKFFSDFITYRKRNPISLTWHLLPTKTWHLSPSNFTASPNALTHKHSSYSTPWSGLHSLCYHPGNALFQEFSSQHWQRGKKGEKTGKKRKTRKIEKKAISANVIIQSHHPIKPWGSLEMMYQKQNHLHSQTAHIHILNSRAKSLPKVIKHHINGYQR